MLVSASGHLDFKLTRRHQNCALYRSYWDPFDAGFHPEEQIYSLFLNKRCGKKHPGSRTSERLEHGCIANFCLRSFFLSILGLKRPKIVSPT